MGTGESSQLAQERPLQTRVGALQHQIGSQQAVILVLMTTCYPMLLGMPARLAVVAGSASAQLLLLSGLIALLLALPILPQLRWVQGTGAAELMRRVFGHVLGTCLGLVVAGWLWWQAVLSLRLFCEGVRALVLQETPLIVLIALFAVVTGWMAALGIEGIARFAFLFSRVLGVGVALGLVGGWMSGIHPTAMFPLLGPGAGKLLVESVKHTGFFYGGLLLWLVRDHLGPAPAARRAFGWSKILTILVLVFMQLAVLMAFPMPTTRDLAYPLQEMAMLLHISRFLQRIEGIYVLALALLGVVGLATTWMTVAETVGSALGDVPTQPLVPSMIFVGMIAATLPHSEMAAYAWLAFWESWPALAVFLVPGLTWLVGWMRRGTLKLAGPRGQPAQPGGGHS